VGHTYANDGSYTVTLQVSDGRDVSPVDTLQITVNNVSPVVNAGDDRSVDEGQSFTLTGSASDPGSGDTLTYTWDFGDGTPPVSTTEASVEHTYPDGPATYTIALQVADDDTSTVDTLQVTVNNLDPVNVSAGGPYTAAVGEEVTLSGSGSDVADDPLTFRWYLNGDFSPDAEGQDVTYSWSAPGTYTIGVLVEDDDGGSTPATTTVDVN
jgi:hypothetical protein